MESIVHFNTIFHYYFFIVFVTFVLHITTVVTKDACTDSGEGHSEIYHGKRTIVCVHIFIISRLKRGTMGEERGGERTL